MIFKSQTMNINFKDAVSYLTFKDLEKYGFFKHAYSTRIGGVSENEFKSLNLGFSTKDSSEKVKKNFSIFCAAFGVSENKLAITSQIHEDEIKEVKNIGKFTVFDGVDGLVTNEPGVTLATFHADCLAVYMIDPEKKAVGLAHAGWRGTVKNIAGKLARKLESTYGCNKENLICALGPSIGSCCFEVSSDVTEIFRSLDIPETYLKDGNKIDLPEVNRRLLLNEGLKDENIIKSDVCTMCFKDLLFSHRATGGKRGTNAAFISLV